MWCPMIRMQTSSVTDGFYTTKLEVPDKCLEVRTCSSESDAFGLSYKVF